MIHNCSVTMSFKHFDNWMSVKKCDYIILARFEFTTLNIFQADIAKLAVHIIITKIKIIILSREKCTYAIWSNIRYIGSFST